MASKTFSPLRYGPFLTVWIGSLLANFGNQIQATGAAWRLTQMGEPADVVALVQTATNLPIMLLAVPAGAWADSFDKRSVMLTAQLAMFGLSALLAVLVAANVVTPALLIGLTALLACGVAVFNPALSASIGGLVPRTELAAAVALNILGFNVARSLGPALGGLIVAAGGVEAAFLVNTLSYLCVILVLWRMARAAPAGTARRPLGEVIAEGLRYSAKTPEIRTIYLRAVTFTLAGGAAWALMPLVADEILHQGSVAFGLLLGALGFGAVIGAATSTWVRSRYSAEAITRMAALIYGLCCMAVSQMTHLGAMIALLIAGGAAWVQALSGFSVAGQLWSPRELVGRITAMTSSLTFGGLAVGAWLWGHVAHAIGVADALLASGGLMLLIPVLGLAVPMPRHREHD